MSATDYIYYEADNRFRLLLRSIYMLVNPPHINPCGVGLLDYPNEIYEALTAFRDGGNLYREMHQSTANLLRKMGAK